MATWMVHLRIADLLLDLLPGISPVEFLVGNLAPDSGVPNPEGSGFTPDTTVSHFRTGDAKADPEAFLRKYFTEERRRDYDDRQLGFYLGYLTHLMTDVLWSEQIVLPALRTFGKESAPDREAFIQKSKENWYSLDFKYLRDHPGFRAFRVYLGAVGFRNDFVEEFSPNAIDDRRQYITDFYLQGKPGPDRDDPYLTETEMDSFVAGAIPRLREWLDPYFLKRN